MLVSVFHLFTLCVTEISAISMTIINATTGEQVLFPVPIHCGAQYEVTFLSKSLIIAKLASWGMKTFHKHTLYENRLQRHTNDSLVLQNVQINDTKVYGIQIECYDTVVMPMKETVFDLRVFEPVSKPSMTMYCSLTSVNLNCSVSKGTNVTLYWEEQSLSGTIHRIYDGAKLVINYVHEQDQYKYKCVAQNPVSNATSDLQILEMCNGDISKVQRLTWTTRNFCASILLLALIVIAYICYNVIICDKRGRINN
ncbi:SLAM family member 5-like isoform X1 [Chiloscyllium plagiosum]|uniref:SLAM family member 5-like isoform X1 n=2 Tax=Chiloscyllium plagiosum TaxID=36176 RepID=UPI001CB88538|nr:SLAM family member 5-like isoform X1 [Chiloscyllium plagiosum]XP_043557895.1 SLAM family member 5-like isoform X1 [Chiloscyllium plagiosum]XP_043557896.1 SLAM family member 5-like isoform X1 [Chiloscyllium plagiosum]XP_043557897.1 SLAM family member 5-like isoform X1 [Chiloscyllium plagiosum]XP_043557898.1 SLAM family member 5-like isoform X1 [Chiloscyllium plagiosum]XP_043557899.1 SLAM family member 5-like isoform X1 [Chiloscyllium plagiosum]XP_043557900.1 SLAM family member 5-like isofor